MEFEGFDEQHPEVQETLKALQKLKGEEFDDVDFPDDSKEVTKALLHWQNQSHQELEAVKAQLKGQVDLPDEQLALAVYRAARFAGKDSFVSVDCARIAEECLQLVSPKLDESNKLNFRIVSIILETHMKPLFRTSPHPGINSDTGRRMHVQKGSVQQYYAYDDEASWKTDGRGCWNVLNWCISRLAAEDFVKLWHLLIPPAMTILDDHELKFRIKGLVILDGLLSLADGAMLKRTGIDELFATSLSTSFSYMTDPEMSTLLPMGVRTALRLIEMTTEPNGQARFNRTCELLSKSIVGGAWLYAPLNNVDVMEASVAALMILVSTLGVGTIRYLKALIPQLCENMVTRAHESPAPRLQSSSARCLLIIMDACKPRIPAWKGMILDAALRCWVQIHDRQNVNDQELLKLVPQVVQRLGSLCPSVAEHEFVQLKDLDPELFHKLLIVDKIQAPES